MAMWFIDERVLVTGAPGTGSTALLSACAAAGATPTGDKHATAAMMRAAGAIIPSDTTVVTCTRDPFEYWYAEWYRSRHRWSDTSAHPWTRTSSAVDEQIRAAVEMSFGDWIRWVHRRRTPGPINAGHVGEADLILRLESVDRDLRERLPSLADRIGELRPMNTTSGRPHHAGAYDADTVAIVARAHRREIDAHGYLPPVGST